MRGNKPGGPGFIRTGRMEAKGQAFGLAANRLGIQQTLGTAVCDGLLDSGQRMLSQQLQHADVLPAAGVCAMVFFQGCPEVEERG